MAKQYSIKTRFGTHMVELSESEERALITEGGVTAASRVILAHAALILSYLNEGPAAPGEIAKAAGINNHSSSSWQKAVAALIDAGLMNRDGYGRTTEYSRRDRAKEPATELETAIGWDFEPSHTLILGAPATGKSNLVHKLIQQVAGSVKDGTAKLYGIDPKGSELGAYEGNLFERVSSGMDRDSHQELTLEVAEVLLNRLLPGVKINPERFNPSVENPVIFLVIEELDWVLDDQELAGRLARILAMGRSVGIYIIGTAQTLEAGKAFRFVQQFANRVLFQQGSRYFNDLVLGAGAAEAGADSTKLEAPRYTNGFSGAGIAYVADGGDTRRVKFDEITGEGIAALIREHSQN